MILTLELERGGVRKCICDVSAPSAHTKSFPGVDRNLESEYLKSFERFGVSGLRILRFYWSKARRFQNLEALNQ